MPTRWGRVYSVGMAELTRDDVEEIASGLENADLSRANLSRANLDRANLTGANLSGANLDGANLRMA